MQCLMVDGQWYSTYLRFTFELTRMMTRLSKTSDFELVKNINFVVIEGISIEIFSIYNHEIFEIDLFGDACPIA